MSEDYQELEEQSISVVQGEVPEAKPPINENSPEAIKQRRMVVSCLFYGLLGGFTKFSFFFSPLP